MKERGGKLWFGLNVAEKIAKAFEGMSAQVKQSNDTWERISFEMKRFNDLQEGKLKTVVRVESKKTLREELKKPAPERPKRAPSAITIPDNLYKSIISISRRKLEFTPTEVINRAMKSSRSSFKKESLRTALQGFKVGSKTAERQPKKCRNLIVPVGGKKGLYRLNPDKMSSSA